MGKQNTQAGKVMLYETDLQDLADNAWSHHKTQEGKQIYRNLPGQRWKSYNAWAHGRTREQKKSEGLQRAFEHNSHLMPSYYKANKEFAQKNNMPLRYALHANHHVQDLYDMYKNGQLSENDLAQILNHAVGTHTTDIEGYEANKTIPAKSHKVLAKETCKNCIALGAPLWHYVNKITPSRNISEHSIGIVHSPIPYSLQRGAIEKDIRNVDGLPLIAPMQGISISPIEVDAPHLMIVPDQSWVTENTVAKSKPKYYTGKVATNTVNKLRHIGTPSRSSKDTYTLHFDNGKTMNLTKEQYDAYVRHNGGTSTGGTTTY